MNNNYIKQETVTGIVPILSSERKYSFIDLFLSTSGFAIATWCYTQGAYIAQYLSFNQMLINVFSFNLIWVLVSCLPVLFAVRYGIDLWIWLRSVLGIKGVAVLSTVISLANFGWYAVAANLFASSMINLFNNFGVGLDPTIWKPLFGCLCVILGTLIALGGPDVIKWTNRFLVVALLSVGVAVIFICFSYVSLNEIMSVKPAQTELSALERFMISAEGNVAFAFSWSTQALVLPRLAKSEKGGYWGTTLSYGIIAPLFIVTGGIMTLATFFKTGMYESDPTLMLTILGSPVVAIVTLLLVSFANIGTQGTGSYVNCMIIKSGIPKLNYKMMVIFAMFYVGILTVSGLVEDYFGTFISMAAYIQGPIIGIILVDYLVLRKRKLSLKSAYYMKGHDAYVYTNGYNLVGLFCILVSFVVTLFFIYNPMNGEIKSSLFYIFTGSGFTAVFGGLLYYLISLTKFRKYMLKDREDLEIV